MSQPSDRDRLRELLDAVVDAGNIDAGWRERCSPSMASTPHTVTRSNG